MAEATTPSEVVTKSQNKTDLGYKVVVQLCESHFSKHKYY